MPQTADVEFNHLNESSRSLAVFRGMEIKRKEQNRVGFTNITRLVQHRDESCIYQEFFPKHRADYKSVSLIKCLPGSTRKKTHLWGQFNELFSTTPPQKAGSGLTPQLDKNNIYFKM